MRIVFFFILTFIMLSANAQFTTNHSQSKSHTLETFLGGLKVNRGFINTIYPDTATANANPISLQPAGQIWVDDILYIRNSTATAWIAQRVGDGWFNIVRDGGADSTGTDDASAIIQGAIEAGWKNIFIPHGTFLVSTQISMEDSVSIYGSGRFTSRIKLTTDISAFHCSFALGGNNTSFSNIGFYGDYATGGLTIQRGISIDSSFAVLVSGISGINMGGFVVNVSQNGYCCGTYVVNAGRSNFITDSYFESNYGGVNFAVRAEYNEVSNSIFTGNLYAIQNLGGNNRITSNSVENNTWGLYMTSGANGGHGVASNNTFNHNGTGVTGANIYLNGITLGFNFSNNTFAENINAAAGLFEIISCSDITFEGGYTARDTIRTTSSTNTIFSNVRKYSSFSPIFVVVSGQAPTVFNVGKVNNAITITDVVNSNQLNITHSNGLATYTATRHAFSGKVLNAQGADVASANNLVLGTDGNTFEITGTTQINLISNLTWQNGSVIRLLFTSTPTVKNGQATSTTNITMSLAGAVDFVATANDCLQLMLCEIGGTQRWVEVSRSAN